MRNTKVVVKAVEEKPVDTFEMTSLAATKANELTATFATAVASSGAVTIKVNKAGSTTAITGTTKWSDDLTSVVFAASANLTAGTYEMTATDSADATKTTSKTAIVENEKVAQIVILNDTALTDPKNKKKAFIYYDVKNQYGESVRESTSITWTVSSDTNPKIDKAAGKITATRSDKEYTYGELLYVTGVYAKTGVTEQKQLTIGMEQSLDTVKTVGFVKNTDKNTILDKLPANFQSGEYVMLYETLDQNENPIDAYDKNISDNNVTFISDNVLLLKNEFKDGKVYTIKGIEYSSVSVEPGQYVDKGGEVNITAISNKTGKKNIMNYVIGGTAILKSVVLSQPAEVVADGESHAIPFVATDMEGNQITNYESIVRTTNTLTLNASEGELVVYEKADGTAGITWTDDAIGWDKSTTHDEVDRSIALTTVVVGGNSDNLILQVSDKARPVAVKSATLKSGATTAIVENDNDTLNLADFSFVDQYGRTMGDEYSNVHNSSYNTLKGQALAFFDYASNTTNDGWNDAYYGVKVEMNKIAANSAFASSQISTGAAVIATNVLTGTTTQVAWNTKPITTVTRSAIGNDMPKLTGEVKNESVKYSVVSISKSDYAKTGTRTAADYDYVGKALNVSYTIVPMKNVTNISVKKLNKQYISIGKEKFSTGAEAGVTAGALAVSLSALTMPATVKTGYEQSVGLAGSYDGVALVIPDNYAVYSSEAGKIDFTASPSAICAATVSSDALKLGDFYDSTKANFVRKDGSDTIKANVCKVTTGALTTYLSDVSQSAGDNATGDAIIAELQQAEPKTTLTFSDAAPAPAKVMLVGETCGMSANKTVLDRTIFDAIGLNADSAGKQKLHADGTYIFGKTVWVKDQYEKTMTTGIKWSYNVSDVKENAGEFAHLDKSFTINGNDTDAINITGAELGDTFTLKYTASNEYGSASESIKITVGADVLSKISSVDGNSTDKDFRTKTLKYAY